MDVILIYQRHVLPPEGFHGLASQKTFVPWNFEEACFSQIVMGLQNRLFRESFGLNTEQEISIKCPPQINYLKNIFLSQLSW